MTVKERHRRLMLEALAEAEKGRDKTFPNPAVGAVVVRRGHIVGRGFHKRWGRPHAEVVALQDAGAEAKGADLYVTLEPCAHWGRTPPCVDAIIRSGIRYVIVPCKDPNPEVRGRGLRVLRRAGVRVEVGPCAREARALNETYFKFMKTGLPFVTLKVAQTLDGKIATRSGEARWVTCAASRKLARRMRSEAQAILVGVNTVRNDDPELLQARRGCTYYRCVVDSDLSIPPRSNLVRTAREHPTIVYCAEAGAAKSRRLEAEGVTIRKTSRGPDGMVSLKQVVEDLGRLGVMHLLVEGGGMIMSSFLKAGLVDRMAVFIAPKILGDVNGLGAFHELGVKRLKSCYALKTEEVDRIGDDVLVMLRPKRWRGGL